MEKIKVGFLYFGDPTNTKYWSGTVSKLHSTIAKSEKIILEDIVVRPNGLTKLVYKITKAISLKKNEYSLLLSYLDSAKANRIVEKSDCNIIFAPACSRLIHSAQKALKSKKLIYLSDATFHKMVGYYVNYSRHDQIIGNKWEKSAHKLASQIILSAEWSCDDAKKYYHTPSEKINILKFGANIDDLGHKVVKADKKLYKLLLVGVDWKRKGIDIAIDTVIHLNSVSSSVKYELGIVGFDKPDKDFPDYIKFYGRLLKSNNHEYKKLVDIYLNHDIFILPTKAECSAIVFAESAMFGLPTFTYRTGGTGDYVDDGVTGICLDPKCKAEDFSTAIQKTIESGKIEILSINARKKYENELNWDYWLKQFEDIVCKVAKEK